MQIINLIGVIISLSICLFILAVNLYFVWLLITKKISHDDYVEMIGNHLDIMKPPI